MYLSLNFLIKKKELITFDYMSGRDWSGSL